MKTDWDWQYELERIIDAAILERYSGDLERWDNPRDGGYLYTPIDVDQVRDLLTKLWGDILTAEAIENAYERLVEQDDHSRDEWCHPDCWCDEEDDENRVLRTAEDEAFDAAWFAEEDRLRAELNLFDDTNSAE